MELYGKKIEDLYLLNELGSSGFYPAGVNGLWHSGIHLTISEPVIPAEEGQIIAYRLIEKYETVDDEKNEKLSSSFVLLKHSIDIQQGDAKKSTKSTIDFFTMYMSLLPDSEYKIVEKYGKDFIELNENVVERTPFYRDWEFKVNQNKAQSFYIYKNNENLFEGCTGHIQDDRYLTSKTYKSLKCSMDNTPGKQTDIEFAYFDITDKSSMMVVKPKNAAVQYFSERTSDFSGKSSRGNAKFTEISAYPDCMEVNGVSCIKVHGDAKQNFTHSAKSGYVFYAHINNISKSGYAHANEKTTGDKVYFYTADPELQNLEKYFYICTYSEFEKCKSTIGSLSNVKLFFSDWNILFNKEQLIRDMDADFSDEKKVKSFKPDTMVIICSQEYNWNKLNNIPNDTRDYFDFSFSDKINAPYTTYVTSSTLEAVEKYIGKTTAKDAAKIKLYKIKRTGEFMQTPENLHLNEKDTIGFISGQLLVSAESHLPETVSTDWIIKSSDLTLVKGPAIKLIKHGKDTSSYSLSSQKGVLLYSNVDGNPCKILTESDGAFELADAENFVRNSYGITYKEIIVAGKKYYIKPSSKDCLKGKLVYNKNVNVDFGKTITLTGSGTNLPVYANQNTCLGYGGEYDFSDKKQSRFFDFVTFTKNTDFTKNKDEKKISRVKSGIKAIYIETSLKSVQQKFPVGTEFSIESKEEMLGYYAYKVKILSVPLYFSDTQLSSTDGEKYLTDKNVNRVWLFDCKITEKGVETTGEFNKANSSVIIDLLGKNYESIRNKKYDYLNKNTDGTCSKLKVNFDSFSEEYYLLSTNNLSINEKEKILTVKDRSILIELYSVNPYEVKETEINEQIEFDNDEGACLNYKGEKYIAVKNDGNSAFVKQSDVDKINLLDWKQFFQILDKSASDDVVCDLQKEIIDQMELNDDEKKEVEETLKDTESIAGVLKNQSPMLVVNTLRKMIVKHPLEWNADLFTDDLKNKLDCSANDYTYLQKSIKKVSIWNDISSLQGIDGQKTLTFAHPLYFINHVEKIKDRTIPFLLEKWGKRITGKTGNVYTLDGGKGRLLSNVEWYSQRDNVGDCAKEVYGYDMCQLTSLAMVMNAMGIKRLHADGQYEDELYNVANLAGYGGSKIWDETLKVYAIVLESYKEGYTSNDITDNRIAKVKEKINSGVPVILSMDYKDDGEHGHVIVIVGYTEKGVIANDPYGDNNTGYKEHNGAFVEYDYNRWSIGKKWACYLSN